MQNDENTVETQDTQTEGQPEVVEETTTEETETSNEGVESKDEGVKLSPAEYRHFKKWVASKGQPAPKVSAQPQNQSVDIDERVLKAQGMPDVLLKQLKDVAKLRGLSLIDAQGDPVFQAIKTQVEQEEKTRKAQLGASRGAQKTGPKKNTLSPGLTREEHMAMAKEIQ